MVERETRSHDIKKKRIEELEYSGVSDVGEVTGYSGTETFFLDDYLFVYLDIFVEAVRYLTPEGTFCSTILLQLFKEYDLPAKGNLIRMDYILRGYWSYRQGDSNGGKK